MTIWGGGTQFTDIAGRRHHFIDSLKEDPQ